MMSNERVSTGNHLNKYQAVIIGFGKAGKTLAVRWQKQVGVWLSSNNQMQCMADLY